MTAAPARASDDRQARTVGKVELAGALGWTRPRLDRRLKTDAAFPVKKRGSQAGGWEFDLAAVRRYLGTEPAAEPDPPPPAIDRAQLAATVAPPAPPLMPPPPQRRGALEHQGEATARQRKDAAQASLFEDKLRQQREELVPRDEVHYVLTTMLTQLGKGLDGLPDAAAKMLGLPDAAIATMRELTDDLRRAMHKDVRAMLLRLIAGDGSDPNGPPNGPH